jgi:hypothetical protein
MFRAGDPWPGLFTGLPPELAELESEPAFDTRNSTFCAWRLASDSGWRRGSVEYAPGDDPDGSADLLLLFDGQPQSYVEFAASYFEREVPVEAVASVYAHKPLTSGLVEALNPGLTLAALEADLSEIDYPREAG